MSETSRNPRADAKLKRLPEEVQAHIAELCTKPGVTQRSILDWIEKECDVKSSPAALSEWLSWYSARAEARASEARVMAFLDEERQLHPELSDAELFAKGQRMFSLLAIATQDPLAWTRVQKVTVLRDVGELERQKFQRQTCELFVKWAADQRAKDISSSSSTNAEKIEALGQLMFGESWQTAAANGQQEAA